MSIAFQFSKKEAAWSTVHSPVCWSTNMTARCGAMWAPDSSVLFAAGQYGRNSKTFYQMSSLGSCIPAWCWGWLRGRFFLSYVSVLLSPISLALCALCPLQMRSYVTFSNSTSPLLSFQNNDNSPFFYKNLLGWSYVMYIIKLHFSACSFRCLTLRKWESR